MIADTDQILTGLHECVGDGLGLGVESAALGSGWSLSVKVFSEAATRSLIGLGLSTMFGTDWHVGSLAADAIATSGVGGRVELEVDRPTTLRGMCLDDRTARSVDVFAEPTASHLRSFLRVSPLRVSFGERLLRPR